MEITATVIDWLMTVIMFKSGKQMKKAACKSGVRGFPLLSEHIYFELVDWNVLYSSLLSEKATSSV